MLDLGSTPLANQLLTEADLTKREPVYPLDIAYCGRVLARTDHPHGPAGGAFQ